MRGEGEKFMEIGAGAGRKGIKEELWYQYDLSINTNLCLT